MSKAKSNEHQAYGITTRVSQYCPGSIIDATMEENKLQHDIFSMMHCTYRGATIPSNVNNTSGGGTFGPVDRPSRITESPDNTDFTRAVPFAGKRMAMDEAALDEEIVVEMVDMMEQYNNKANNKIEQCYDPRL
jgi:hypothetical protein